MYYHASSVKDIKELEPRISNHGMPLIYFSKKRENVLVYLSNAIEKYCKETGFRYNGVWQKWASYGFDEDGKQYIEEYYPNALEKTYKGVSGYIYSVEKLEESGFDLQISDAVASSVSVRISEVEYIPDAYIAIIEAERKDLLRIFRYEESTEKQLAWIRKTIKKEYEEAIAHPEYRHFLRGNFPNIIVE